MATQLGYHSSTSSVPKVLTLDSAATGNADSDIVDLGSYSSAPVALELTTTVGATPTVTINIQGSNDGTNFYNVGYALAGTPTTETQAAITITTATTNRYNLIRNRPYRYLKVVRSANTNVTLTTKAYLFA